MPSLSIVLPAYNEEASIGAVAAAACAAAPALRREAALDAVEVLVVDDGSTDRTAERARAVTGVRLVSFRRNRGYGVALKAGFDAARGDLLAFCDADGTCDPADFGALAKRLLDERLDIVIGSRLGQGNRMPFVRRVGNHLFATLLGVLSLRSVRDTASGMRVLRREALVSLYPLPDGLNFTPAMTARALLSQNLGIGEVPISYAERSGESKLRVVADGLQFLRTICETALLFQPFRILASLGFVFLLLTVGLAITPGLHYLQHGRLEETTTYRVVMILVFAIVAQGLVVAGALGEEVKELFVDRSSRSSNPFYRLSTVLLTPKPAAATAAVLVFGLLLLAGPGLYRYLMTGSVAGTPWHRILVGGYLGIAAAELCAATLLAYLLHLVRQERGPRSRPATGTPSVDALDRVV